MVDLTLAPVAVMLQWQAKTQNRLALCRIKFIGPSFWERS